MTINGQTRIAALLRMHPEALEAIVSIHPRLEKLRNPVLRKLMAGRTTIAMASKVAGCHPDAFFEKLRPLGFEHAADGATEVIAEDVIPLFVHHISPEQVITLDVRPLIAAGNDPLNLIVRHTRSLKSGQLLKIVNSFYPGPLVQLLEKQGFGSFTKEAGYDLVETFFYLRDAAATGSMEQAEAAFGSDDNWDDILVAYAGHMKTVDVRHLEMPLPMMTILESLDRLAADEALFVYHKRLPVFLLPELASRKFRYVVNRVNEEQLNMLIFR
ncbi:DUF2249 domain-containing protein [Flavihumibacter petaseus]|uniref:DUF2249 domain-containing protein n=1 Tax=Flavihumibacter petaseus NBRC 106054 TaxID=1220578 RepID=A0A0E9MZ78_9BACT|nr:DUF2249 domain-containing protein [Flavihumibacter petaseus]GAO42691.1 hypothetical protein FPE01S_01_17070 [Flavihumibacter petaseus NBRC 106054]